ncbi:uncharacterized protein si:ch211-102c2.4 [Hemibagrus wyckioides]|uniref:uncharacterized protein si:ch211-102c2.4 n=1 Tax=Hemibagrus wyckioides TaxID=337641 RepID=UPI00266D8B71|nr:uncharacterized protein si:ch211-102c2.4 [Hemibagrus wyckioides]
MFLFTSTLIFISTVVYHSHAEQTLECPYSQSNKYQERVWCKRDPSDPNCCTGFSFGSGTNDLDNGRLSVSDNGTTFVISVKSLSQGDGVYWCGVTSGNKKITKLAEKEIHNSIHFVWAILRYLLFGLLLLTVISTHVFCSRRKAKE